MLDDLSIDSSVEELEDEKAYDAAVMALAMELASSSDEEEEEDNRKQHGGSKHGRSKAKPRDFPGAYARVVGDYFMGPASKYNEKDFERRFRVPRAVFSRVHDKVMGQYPFVGPLKDAVGKPGIYPLVKLVACFRYVAYGDAFDSLDEYLQMSEDSVREATKLFTKLMVQNFPEYLNRCPSEPEKSRLFEKNATRGFPGLLASWDCKHFVWHNCPMRWQGVYKGHADGGKITVILEAIADYNCYIWYTHFGEPGSLNDINVLDKSSIVGSMMDGSLDLTCPLYQLNGTMYDYMYFLADGIYPDWGIFVKTYEHPLEDKKKHFALRQESVRKDVERAFGILVKKFHVLHKPLKQWYLDEIKLLMQSCIILHNMVVEHYGEEYLNQEEAQVDIEERIRNNQRRWPLFGTTAVPDEVIAADGVDLFAARSAAFTSSMTSSTKHFKLKRDLTEHVYNIEGN